MLNRFNKLDVFFILFFYFGVYLPLKCRKLSMAQSILKKEKKITSFGNVREKN